MDRRFRQFMIVGTQRTGSSAFAEKLSLHPQVACGWELTESWDVLRKVHVMEQVLSGNFSGVPSRKRQHLQSALDENTVWLGFRRLFGATDKWLFHPSLSAKLLTDRFESHLRWFTTHPDVHILHIRRRDDLEWLKSKYIARKTDSFSGKSYPENIQVHIPQAEAKRRVAAKYWIDSRLRSLANSNPYHQVVYEDFAEQPVAATTGALSLLACDGRDVPWGQAVMKQQSRKKAADYISNIEEIERAVAEARDAASADSG